MENNLKISLIVPCYNEELNLQKGTLDKIGNFTKDDQRFIEIIISDDGSTDKTKKIIEEKYLKIFPKFKLLKNHHQGKAGAIISAIKKAKGNWVFFTDFDLATPIEEVEKLIYFSKKDFSIIIGSRKTHREGAPVIRKIMALGFIFLRNLLLDLRGIKDTQCGFKIFKKSTALKIIKKLKVFSQRKKVKNSSVSAGFDLEFLFLAQKLGFNIKEVPVSWKHVETKNVSFLKDVTETVKDIIKIKYFQIKGFYS